jgi:hypothetical protein
VGGGPPGRDSADLPAALQPRLNPGQFLNQDVKTNAAGRWRPSTQGKMMDNLRSYVWNTQKCQDVARRFVHATWYTMPLPDSVIYKVL